MFNFSRHYVLLHFLKNKSLFAKLLQWFVNLLVKTLEGKKVWFSFRFVI